MINDSRDLKNLFDELEDNDVISKRASNVIINNLDGTNIAGCIGAEVEDLETDDVTVVSLILDSSASMNSNQQAVREGYDNLIQALKDSKQAGSMLVSARMFDSCQKIFYGFTKVEDIKPIGYDYIADGDSTTLYDTLVDALIGIRSYCEELNSNGIRTKVILVVFSDGDDNNSQKNRASDVKTLSEEFLKKELYYLVYIGFKQYETDNLEAIAKEVGFPNVLTVDATGSEIRKVMGLVSKSIIQTSQSQIGPTNSFFE